MAVRIIDAERLARLGEIPAIPSQSARDGIKPGTTVGVLVQEGEERSTRYVTITGREGKRYNAAPQDPEQFGGQHRVVFGPQSIVDVGGASSRRTMAGVALVAIGLGGLWWDARQRAQAQAAEEQRRRAAQAQANALLRPNPAMTGPNPVGSTQQTSLLVDPLARENLGAALGV